MVTSSQIEEMFEKYEGAGTPDLAGEIREGPLFLSIKALHEEYGDSVVRAAYDAIWSTNIIESANIGVMFLGSVEGSHDMLYDIALKHHDERCRKTAMWELHDDGEVVLLRKLHDEMDMEDRCKSFAAYIVIMLDALAYPESDKWRNMACNLVSVMFSGRYNPKMWQKGVEMMGEGRVRTVIRQVLNHPYLPDSRRENVLVACGGYR